jgi:pantetheine-phosphate adenylyltransferase
MRVAVYPASFDPFHHGHLDIVERAHHLFDRVVVAVSDNPGKKPLFPVAERLELIRASVPDIEVEAFDGFTVDFARRMGAIAIIRGLRAVLDFEAEFQMALMNRKLAPEIATVFLMSSIEYQYLSSSLIKELCALGGNIDEFVTPKVAERLRAYLRPPSPKERTE